MRNAVSICLLLAVAAIGAWVLFKHHAAPDAAPLAAKVETKSLSQPVPAPPRVETPTPSEPIALDAAAPEPRTPPREASPPKVASQAKPQKPAQQQGGGSQADPPPKDEAAREALSYVGIDPEAEEYWIGAINNPDLPAAERSNLIEDLNEDGLSDPKHPAPGDLPIILNRLALIEELADNAMDKANADAFQEAYKDLVNLADLAMGGGEPVR